MTPIELHRLAAALTALRPDWPPASIHTWLTRNLAHRPLADIAAPCVTVAVDPASVTLARVLEAGPWWPTRNATRNAAQPNPCRTHTDDPRLRVDPVTGESTCAGCHADQHANPDASATFDRRPAPDSTRRAPEHPRPQRTRETR